MDEIENELEEINPKDSFAIAWKEAQEDNTYPIESLWDGIDEE